MDNLVFASAGTLARAIRDRTLSSTDVIEAHLDRIAAVNPALNAVVQLTADTARAEARAADAALARGENHGPLHGVPFTVKDTFETAGVINAMGMPERATFVPAADATVVARLRAAGGILLGKTNIPPGGGGLESDNPVYGRTNNPYDLTRTPGGSSGGEAAIIAAGGSPLGIGSDSGGSIRLPAHNCGIAGIRPTNGRVPSTNGGRVDDVSDPRTQTGLLARTVGDLALALPLIAGMDWWDASVIPMPLLDPAEVNLTGLRIAFYTDDGISTPTPETAATVRAAASVLAEAGAAVDERRPDGMDRAWDITQGVWASWQGEMLTADYYRLTNRWSRLRSRMLTFMREWDAIICPVCACPAVRHGMSTDYTQATMISYTVLYSLTGWPSVTVRGGTSPEGLPIGVQVVARPWREDVALAVAARIEAALGGWQPPPL